jgi:hypothetical protein
MNSKHRKTLEAIFSEPVSKSMPWSRIESLFVALGAEIIEGDGSRVRFVLNEVVGSFHCPHPYNSTIKFFLLDKKNHL